MRAWRRSATTGFAASASCPGRCFPKSQIWIAVSVYVLVAIVRKRLNLSRSLYEILQILSLNQFEKTPLDMLLSRCVETPDGPQIIS